MVATLQVYALRAGVWTALGRGTTGGGGGGGGTAYNRLTYGFGPYGSYVPDKAFGTAGIPPGSPPLTPQYGTSGVYAITTPGVYDLIDFHCEVQPRVRGVELSRCLVRGNPARSSNGALATIGGAAPYGTGTIAKFYDCEFIPDSPSIWQDGILNHDYEAHRCYVRGTVDPFGAYGSGSSSPANVALYGNHTEKQAYFSPDPNHSGDKPISKTHNDGGVQWQGGAGLTVVGNHFVGYLDPAIGEANYSSTSPHLTGGGPNNPSAGSGYNVNYPALQVDGSILQISGTNGGNCSGLDWHDNFISGSNRPLTVSQTYPNLGTMHDDTITHDHLASVWGNIPDTVYGSSLTVSNIKYTDGTHVSVFSFHKNADGSTSGVTVVTS